MQYTFEALTTNPTFCNLLTEDPLYQAPTTVTTLPMSDTSSQRQTEFSPMVNSYTGDPRHRLTTQHSRLQLNSDTPRIQAHTSSTGNIRITKLSEIEKSFYKQNSHFVQSEHGIKF